MRAIYPALLAMWVGMSASNLDASPIAFDTAGDSAYNNFNPNTSTYPNGGYGWGGLGRAMARCLSTSQA